MLVTACRSSIAFPQLAAPLVFWQVAPFRSMRPLCMNVWIGMVWERIMPTRTFAHTSEGQSFPGPQSIGLMCPHLQREGCRVLEAAARKRVQMTQLAKGPRPKDSVLATKSLQHPK